MNGPEWDKQRARAILAAFQTGRPVFADSDGKFRYVDGAGEPLTEDVGLPKDLPWWSRLRRWWGGDS